LTYRLRTKDSSMIDPSKRVCGSCRHMGHDNAGQGQCQRYPPLAMLIPIPGPLGNMQIVVKAFRPSVREEERACGEWGGRPDIVN
jgi:hypothetical protein